MRVLFQGDSITDAGRERSDPRSLGNGYASLVAQDLIDLEFYNRGVSGNRIFDLEARWDFEFESIQPDLVTILIGINDTWRRYDSNLTSDIPEFHSSLDRIAKKVRGRNSRLILLEPFLLPIPKDRERWREDLDPRIHTVRQVAREYADAFIPLDGIFAAASCRTPMKDLAADGVHPTPAGHRLIADSLLPAIKQLIS